MEHFSAMPGRLKLVFTRDELYDAAAFHNIIKPLCKRVCHRIKTKFELDVEEPEIVTHGSADQCSSAECTITATSRHSPMWNHTFDVCAYIVNRIQRYRLQNEDSFPISIHANLLVQDRIFFRVSSLKAAALCVRTASVKFGNLFGPNMFMTHNEIDQNTENNWYGNYKQMWHYYGVDLCDHVSNDTTIYCDFEHDKRIMNIAFPMLWPEKVNGKMEEEKVETIARLKLKYSLIRRVICDFSKVTEEGKLVIYLHVFQPAAVSVIKTRRRGADGNVMVQERNELHGLPGDRHAHWLSKDAYTTEFVKKDAKRVTESPYIRLEIPVVDLEACVNIVGRLSAMNQKPIEVRTIRIANEGKMRCKHVKSPFNDAFRGKLSFSVLYIIDALFSRGAHVTDQLLRTQEQCDRFMELFEKLRENDKARVREKPLLVDALERLLRVSEERVEMVPLHILFGDCIRQAEADLIDEKSAIADGYVYLRKVSVTPSRFIFDAPELIMGNRVLRVSPQDYPPDKFLRVQFRDEDWTRIVPNIGKGFIKYYVSDPLEKGIKVGGREYNYLGSSNSQMREQGCYFIEAKNNEITEFRRLLGSFNIESVPKLMARFGQCFTQSVAMGEVLPREAYTMNYDYEGGRDSNGKEYTFSDGVGCISKEFALAIAKSMKLDDCVPSCFQMRFRGYKGVVALNPIIDAIRELSLKQGIDETDRKVNQRYRTVSLWFRPSQHKFDTQMEEQKYEVVKISGPSAVSLNRPLINILDQVSEKQGEITHKRMCDRIQALLDQQLRTIASTLCDEMAARVRIGEFPRMIMYDVLSTVNLTNEPFFRSMLRMAARCTLKRLRNKLQIAIPTHLGRSMLGVVDETGILGHGEIFARYTVNVQEKRPGPHAARKTLTGPVLVTKNPMIVGGDVRMFTAVDVPALHHMCDVVVFPRWGPRPHPDEMAGSDLDGDEYCVIWDTGLFLAYNEEAFDYTSQPPKDKPTEGQEEILKRQMIDFFINYITHDSIGKLATAFLINSDIYGIDHEVCQAVAKKHQSAVDFTKTGVPATKLERGRDGKPSEDPPRRPDFMEQASGKPAYQSNRLNGRLFRLVKEIDDMLQISVEDDLNTPPPLDEAFICKNIPNEIMLKAKNNFVSYRASIDNMLQRFGIGTEVEVFSNSYSAIRKRISDKDEDDMSYFNTQRLIDDELERTFSRHRKAFFESFGDEFSRLTSLPRHEFNADKESRRILRSVAGDVPENLMMLASAYYKVAYSQLNQHHLSFAWLAADVLFKVRHRNLRANSSAPTGVVKYSFDPLSEEITHHLEAFCTKELVLEFRNRMKNSTTWKIIMKPEGIQGLRALCSAHQGLRKLLLYVHSWISQQPCFKKMGDKCWKTLLVFITFGLRQLPEQAGLAFLDEQYLKLDEPRGKVNLNKQTGGLGRKFFEFVRHLAGLRFGHSEALKFPKELQVEADYDTFSAEDARSLHKAAMLTYYQLCFMNEANVLPRSSTDRRGEPITLASLPAVDGRSICCEIHKDHKAWMLSNDVRNALLRDSGCNDIFIRVDRYVSINGFVQLAITMSGSLEATNKLQALLTPKLNPSDLRSNFTEKQMAEYLARQIVDTTYELAGRTPPPRVQTYDFGFGKEQSSSVA